MATSGINDPIQPQAALPNTPKESTVKLPEAPTYSNYTLPNVPAYTAAEMPSLPTVAPIEKPSFSTYFENNIKPVFSKMLNDNLAQNPQLIQNFANQYRRDINPLVEQLGSSIYGSNVGATSGLGAEAYAKGAARIMQPVTDYANNLNANTIGQYQDTMNSMAQSGLSNELDQNINEYNTNQDRLYDQGQQTYKDTLKNKQDAATYANNMAMTTYQNSLGQSRDAVANENARKNLDYSAQLNQASLDKQSERNTAETNRKAIIDLASAGKLGSTGADTLAAMIGLTPEQTAALKSAPRAETIQNYLQSMLAANQAPDPKVLDSLLATGEKPLLTEEEKKKYAPAITMAPAGLAAKLFNTDNSTVKQQLVDYGFEYDVVDNWSNFVNTPSWQMKNSVKNNELFNNLYSTNDGFRNWVSTIA